MNIKQQLMEDMKQAMRDRNTIKLSAIRFLMAEIKNREIDDGELDDAKITQIIQKQVKQIKEVMEDFAKVGKTEVIEEERAKISALEAYLPKQLDDSQLEAIIDDVMASVGQGNMGVIMAGVREKVGNQADGSRIAQVVKAKLAV